MKHIKVAKSVFPQARNLRNFTKNRADAYSEPCQTSKMECFAKVSDG